MIVQIRRLFIIILKKIVAFGSVMRWFKSSDTYEIEESITVVFDSKEAEDDFLDLIVTDVKK